MDKQTLRYTYLTYFAGQYAKKEELSFDTLEEMAGGNFNLEKEVLKDLINEELIEGIEISEDKLGTKIIQHNGKLKLTTKGIKEILNLFPDEKKEIIKDIKFDIENQKHKILTLEDIINKENERIAKLSKKEKIKEIKEKIFLLFWDYNININKYAEGKILHSEIKSKIRKIVQHYYDGAISTLSKEAINELRLEGYVQYKYEDRNSEIQISTLLTPKGIAHIKNEQEKKESELQEYIEKNNLKIPNEIIKIQSILAKIYSKTNSTQLQAATDMMKNSKVQVAMKALESIPVNRVMQNINKYYSPLYNESVLNNYGKLINSINNSTKTIRNNLNSDKKSLSEIINDPPSNLYKALTNGSKSNNDPKAETYTFEGILGQNCGDYIYIDDKNTDDRLPERIINEKTGKHFIVKNGIKVLRGFAKASDLYNASEPDKKNYQRNEDFQHLQEIKTFLSEINPSGKYLPELTFVARGGYELIRPEWGNNLKTTNLGHFKNLDYYQLNLNGTKLYRIDGNHRLEALKKLSDENKEYYIPFAIILMGKQILFDNTDELESSIGLEYSGNYGLSDDAEEKKITDMEAFLFYFLNAKAKKLTTEENLKGLVNSTSWGNHELMVANKYLPLLQYLEKEIKTNNFLNSYFCNNEPIKNIAEILEKINDDINLEQFKVILSLTNELLIFDKWNDLKQFRFYCQLVFYIAYKNPDKNICLSILNNINNWVKKYKFDNTTFDNPIMLYHSAEKTNNISPIKVFVAMPYYDDEIIEDVNDQLKKLSEELIKKYPLLKNRLEIYEVMKHRGYEIDIQEQIIEQIKTANIFIADISEHICKKGTKKVDSHANPNVMYELGLAKGQTHTEIILLKNKKDKIEVPSDIITKYHNKFEFDKKVSMRKKLFEAIENILKDKFEII